MPRVRATLLALIVAPLAACLLAVGPARAAPAAPVPPDVTLAFSGAVPWLQEAFEGDPVLERATGVRDIVEVFAFTPAYLHGESGPAIESSESWAATIVDALGAPIGLMTVWRPEGGVAEISGGSAWVGGDLAEVGSGIYIEEPMIGAAFVLRGQLLSPFNEAARALLPRPATLDEFQSVLAAWVAESIATANDLGPNYPLWFFVGGLVLSTAVGVLVIVQRRRLERLPA